MSDATAISEHSPFFARKPFMLVLFVFAVALNLSTASTINFNLVDASFNGSAIASTATAMSYFRHPIISASIGLSPENAAAEVAAVVRDRPDIPHPRIVSWANICRKRERRPYVTIRVKTLEKYMQRVLHIAQLAVYLPVPAIRVAFPSGERGMMFERDGETPRTFYTRIKEGLEKTRPCPQQRMSPKVSHPK